MYVINLFDKTKLSIKKLLICHKKNAVFFVITSKRCGRKIEKVHKFLSFFINGNNFFIKSLETRQWISAICSKNRGTWNNVQHKKEGWSQEADCLKKSLKNLTAWNRICKTRKQKRNFSRLLTTKEHFWGSDSHASKA